MGKKKNLTHTESNSVKFERLDSSKPPSSEHCNGHDVKNCHKLTNGVAQNGQAETYENGVDLDSVSSSPKSHNRHNSSSQAVAKDDEVINGPSETEISNQSDTVLLESIDSRNSFSSSPSQNSVTAASKDVTSEASDADDVTYIVYESELQMPDIMRLIQKDLSEPYSIYTYRYFIHNWPHLCFMAHVGSECVGAIVCKLDFHKKIVKRGYIAMLAVDSKHRKKKIGSTLVKKAIQAMIAEDADEVVLETEITNKPALRLYENLGFVRDKRLFRYYLNGVDALRLKLWLR